MSNVIKWLEQLTAFRKAPGSKDDKISRETPKDLLDTSPEMEQKAKDEVHVREVEKRELEENFQQQVELTAYFLWRDGWSYNDLCWFLAEKILKKTYKLGTPLSISETTNKAEEIFTNSLTYDELCWLNAEMDLIIKKYFDI